MILLEKLKILTPFQKLPKILRDLGKLIVAKGFEKLPKVQLIAQSGHTALSLSLSLSLSLTHTHTHTHSLPLFETKI